MPKGPARTAAPSRKGRLFTGRMARNRFEIDRVPLYVNEHYRTPLRHNGRPMIPHDAFTETARFECSLPLPIALGTVDDDDRLNPDRKELPDED